MCMRKHSVATIYDVADLAKVSMATVSRVLNSPDKVNIATKEKVLNAVKELGYVPNPIARDLALKKTTSINIVVSDITRIYVPQIIKGILDSTDSLNYSLKISSIAKKNKLNAVINYIIAEKTGGVILINDDFIEGEISLMKKTFQINDIHLIILDTKTVDNENLAYNDGVNAMKMLLNKL